jgi:CheY-like chemotaxis protein
MMISRILLIDDDLDDQDIFVTALAETSDTIVCNVESSARQALQKLKDEKLNTDLIFLDLNMPIMDGKQFLVALKGDEILKDIRVIILSTSSDPRTIAEVTSLGADKFFTKPNGFGELKNILHSILV